METLEELNQMIEEKESRKNCLYNEIQEKKEALRQSIEELESEWSALIEEVGELRLKAEFLKQGEINEEEKAEVNKKLEHLDLILNQPNVVEVLMIVAEPNYESKNLTIRMKTEFENEGLKLEVSIWSNRKAVINLVKSYIHVPVQWQETYYQTADYYSWKKEEKPDIQIFKRTI